MRVGLKRALTGAALLTAVPAVFAGTACAATPRGSAAMASTTIKVGTGPVEDFAQLFVATKKGYFAKNHLKVVTTPVANGPTGVAAIKSGSLNITFSATLPLFLANQSGLNLRYLGPGDTETPGHWQYYMSVPRNSSISTLRGAFAKDTKIGWIGSSTPNAIAVSLWMRKLRITSSNVTFVTLAPPDILTALTSGEVQAAIPLEPFTTIGLQSKSIKTVGQPLDTIMGSDVPTGGYFTSATWAKAHPGLVNEFNSALAEATQFIDAKPKQADQIIGAALKLKPAVVKALPPIKFVSQLSLTGIQKEIYEANSTGLLKAKLKANSLFTS